MHVPREKQKNSAKRVKSSSANEERISSDRSKRRRESSFEKELMQTNTVNCLEETSRSKESVISENPVSTPPCTPPRKQRKRTTLSPSSQQIINELVSSDSTDLSVDQPGKYLHIASI